MSSHFVLQDGTTSLKNAVQGNHGEVASLLVENGANPNDVYKVSHDTRAPFNTLVMQATEVIRLSNICRCHL